MSGKIGSICWHMALLMCPTVQNALTACNCMLAPVPGGCREARSNGEQTPEIVHKSQGTLQARMQAISTEYTPILRMVMAACITWGCCRMAAIVWQATSADASLAHDSAHAPREGMNIASLRLVQQTREKTQQRTTGSKYWIHGYKTFSSHGFRQEQKHTP